MQLKFSCIVFLLTLICSHVNGQHHEIDRLSAVLVAAKTDIARIQILNDLALAYLKVNPTAARDDLNIAYENANKINYRKGVAYYENVMGGVEWSLGNYARALELYFQSLRKDSGQQDIALAIAKNNIGEVYKKTGHSETAGRFLWSAMRLFEKYGHETLGYINIGELYLIRENYDSAMYFFTQAAVSNSVKKDPKYDADVCQGIGEVQLATRQLRPALQNARKSLNLRIASNDLRGCGYSYLLLAKVYHELKKTDSAFAALKNGLRYAREVRARDIEMDILKNQALLYADKGSYDSAYLTYLKHVELKDSLFNEDKATHIARLQTLYETEILQQRNETAKFELRQRNAVILIILMLLILSTAVAAAFYRQKSIQLRINRLLKTKNERIRRQSQQIQAQAQKVTKLNNALAVLNRNLEGKVKSRTFQLKEKNKLLAEYAHSNAHELRAPVASVIGLVDLLKRSSLEREDKEIVNHLCKSTRELEVVVRDIRIRLEKNNNFLSEE